ncbi:MAG: glycosyltransferase family 4 protein [Candidatus Fermentibacter sp.]|nr:glycosyltransferase family 4 protein [Candidatus Fermentibacter sp.]
MATSPERRLRDSTGRPTCAMFTPLPPLATGVATYSLRLILLTRDIIDWKVFFEEGSDPALLPADVMHAPLSTARTGDLPRSRVFMLGNSPECAGTAFALMEHRGCGVFHETVMHHMLRFCCLRDGRIDLYRRLLGFDYGPDAKAVERSLSRRMPPSSFDALLKRHPLVGSLVHASDPTVCLNAEAADALGRLSGGRRVFVVGHPLDPPAGPVLPPSALDSPVAGMVGGGHPGRNADVFVEALHILRSSGLPVSGALIGGGWPGDLPGWVTNTGRLDDARYQGWIRALSVAVDIRHPSCNETSGSLLEAMRAGVPAVLTDSGPFSRIDSGAVMRIPSPPDAKCLAAAIRRVLTDPALAAGLSAGGSRHAAAESSPERARSDWLRIAAMEPPPDPFTIPGPGSLAAALHDPPQGFSSAPRPDTGPSCWSFEGTVVLDPPPGRPVCLLSASGTGRAGSEPLQREPRVFELRGRVVLEGSGRVSQITWMEAR